MKQLKITTKITSRDSFSIDKYLNEISKLPMLSEEEEVIVAKKIRDGDHEAMDKLIQSNLDADYQQLVLIDDLWFLLQNSIKIKVWR